MNSNLSLPLVNTQGQCKQLKYVYEIQYLRNPDSEIHAAPSLRKQNQIRPNAPNILQNESTIER